jgi:hypothetical protein
MGKFFKESGMIRGRKLIIYTTAANAVSKGYWKVLVPSIQSVTKHEFVDGFSVLHGESKDGTREKLTQLSDSDKKIESIASPEWDPNAWTWKILLDQYNFFLNQIELKSNEINQEIIILYQGSDQVWHDSYAKELEIALTRMIDEGYDYMLTPFRKTVNVNHITPIYPYHSTGYSVYSAMRIRPGQHYVIGGNEDVLKTNFSMKRMHHNFKNSSVSYDMTFFTRDQILNKIKNHACGITQKEVDDYIKNGFLRKCLAMKLKKIDVSDHPVEMQDMIKSLDENYFGKTCFGHFKD